MYIRTTTAGTVVPFVRRHTPTAEQDVAYSDEVQTVGRVRMYDSVEIRFIVGMVGRYCT
jgi:hypothetical protein